MQPGQSSPPNEGSGLTGQNNSHSDQAPRAYGPSYMQPPTAGPPGQADADPPVKRPSPIKKIALIAGVLAALLVIFSVSVVAFPAMFGKSVNYDELTRTNTVRQDGDNIALSHPVEMKEVLAGKTSIELRHSGEDGRGMIADLHAEAVPIGSSHMAAAREEFTNDLTDQNSQYYRAIAEELDEELDNFEMGEFRTFANKDGSAQSGLVADISYDLPLAEDEAVSVGAKGQFIMVFGQDTIFRISVSALEDVWRDNQAVFEDMIKSIEIESS